MKITAKPTIAYNQNQQITKTNTKNNRTAFGAGSYAIMRKPEELGSKGVNQLLQLIKRFAKNPNLKKAMDNAPDNVVIKASTTDPIRGLFCFDLEGTKAHNNHFPFLTSDMSKKEVDIFARSMADAINLK